MARVNYNPIYANGEDKDIKAGILYLNATEMSDEGPYYLYTDEECTNKATCKEVVDLFTKGLCRIVGPTGETQMLYINPVYCETYTADDNGYAIVTAFHDAGDAVLSMHFYSAEYDD